MVKTDRIKYDIYIRWYIKGLKRAKAKKKNGGIKCF